MADLRSMVLNAVRTAVSSFDDDAARIGSTMAHDASTASHGTSEFMLAPSDAVERLVNHASARFDDARLLSESGRPLDAVDQARRGVAALDLAYGAGRRHQVEVGSFVSSPAAGQVQSAQVLANSALARTDAIDAAELARTFAGVRDAVPAGAMTGVQSLPTDGLGVIARALEEIDAGAIARSEHVQRADYLDVAGQVLRESKLGLPTERVSSLAVTSGTAAAAPDAAANAVPALEEFGTDLTQRARDGKLGDVVGRDEELADVIAALKRTGKNNPMLVGPPGVGKTAVVEKLALQIARDGDDLPAFLKGKRVIMVDLNRMTGDTSLRGQFEARLTRVIDEIKADPDVLSFIDETHTLLGAGSAQGTAGASEALKPPLARGELRLIGATTQDEFAKYISADPALERRFVPVRTLEQPVDDVREILERVVGRFEAEHGIRIPDSVLDDAIELTVDRLPSRYLPDKAIDAIDGAASRFALDRETGGRPVSDARRAVERLENRIARVEGFDDGADELVALREQLAVANEARDRVVAEWKQSLDGPAVMGRSDIERMVDSMVVDATT